MAAAKKRIGPIVLRFLLLTGYLFLFATQVNYRYYSIANFFVYGSNAVSAGHRAVAAVSLQKETHGVLYRKVSQRTFHLGVDKRFQGVDAIRMDGIFFQPHLSSREIERRYGILLQVYASSLLPVNSLRGPPSA